VHINPHVLQLESYHSHPFGIVSLTCFSIGFQLQEMWNGINFVLIRAEMDGFLRNKFVVITDAESVKFYAVSYCCTNIVSYIVFFH